MTPMVILGLAAILSTLALNMIAGWDLRAAAACPGSEAFCNGVWWTAVSDHLPGWLFVGLLLVTITLASPRALFKI